MTAQKIRNCDAGTEFAAALTAGRKAGPANATDAQNMAMFCEDTMQIMIGGAYSQRLVWEGAQKAGLTTLQLHALCHRKDRAALDDLQYHWEDDEMDDDEPEGNPGGAALINTERQRQIDAGHDADHDLKQPCGTFASAAVAYICHARQDTPSQHYLHMYWPPEWSFKPGKPLDDLVKAGALALAEADRIADEIDRLYGKGRG